MTQFVRWGLIAATLTSVAAATAQMDRPELMRPDDRDANKPLEGPWLTDRMMDGLMNKFADDMGKRYRMDPDQTWQTRQLLQEKFPQWLNENRGRIQPLVNYYVESLLHDEPPDPTVVADWATEVMPLLDSFTEVLEGTTDDMREYLTEEQQVRLEGEMAAFYTMRGFLDRRLENWANEGFDPVTEWPKGAEFERTRVQRDREVQEAMARAERETVEAALGGEAQFIERPGAEEGRASAGEPRRDNDPWSQYVAEFIKKYDLNADQQGAARKILLSMQQQRDDYLRRVDSDITRIERLLVESESEAEKNVLIAKYEKLAEPVYTKFQVLKERLNKLPTRAQRRAAAEKETEFEATREELSAEAVRQAVDGDG